MMIAIPGLADWIISKLIIIIITIITISIRPSMKKDCQVSCWSDYHEGLVAGNLI
jgi:hypothetical protein